jgi:hypothetical protein
MVEEGDLATALCKLYVWLRYSASRQLTWQRNYNTQPRILGEAQARLTHAIAQVTAADAGFMMLSAAQPHQSMQPFGDEYSC